MTPPAITEQPRKKSRDTVENSPEPEPVFYKSTSGSLRNTLRAAGAFVLSLLINLALLGFIGYMDSGQATSSGSETVNTRHTIELRQIQEVTARKDKGSRDREREEPSSEQNPARTQPPAPEPVSKTKPLELKQISSDFDVERPRFRVKKLNILDQTAPSTQSKDASSSSSSTSESGNGDAFQRGKLDRLPRKISGPDPAYPLKAKRNRREGWVMLKLDVSRDGTVSNIRVINWKGSPQFKESAVEAVRQWTFKPGRVNGRPVNATDLRQRIRFQLVE